jgi:S1-C subfamily serine protease
MRVRSFSAHRAALNLACGFALSATALLATSARCADAPDTVQRVKAAVVAVGTYAPSRNPQFAFLGTGFAVGDGTIVATSAHLLTREPDNARRETVAVAVPGARSDGSVQVHPAKALAINRSHDLALLQLEGGRLPALALGDSAQVREGQTLLFTGFPLGTALGLVPATHRAMLAAVTPIALPSPDARSLAPRAIKRLASGPLTVFQLDGTAYPGNSGSPLYDPDSGAVLGIISMVVVKGSKEAALAHPSGISYAVPVDQLKALLRSAQ